MSLIPLKYPPGVCKVNSPYSDKAQGGRFSDMEGAIFTDGLPEKIGGWVTAISTPVTGTPRGLKDWRDNSSTTYLGIGTHSKLMYMSNGALTDITPWRSILTGTLTNAIDTTISSTTVTVHHTAHGLSTGDYVQLVAGSAVGGITPAGIFNPITKVDANTYTIVNGSAATSSVSSGGGTISYIYYRITLTNPFNTTINSATVTVNHTAHGAAVGDYVTISASSAVGGITPSGEVQVVTSSPNSWTFTWTSIATSTVTGGGGTPNFQYDLSVGNIDSVTSFGYGTGTYGSGGYGQNGAIGVTTPPRVWSLAKYGQQLLASPYGGTIYIWDPTIAGRAYPMYNAPSACLAMLVTPERFVFAIGSTSNFMQLKSSDQTDYTQWTAAVTNTAFSRTLQEGSYLIGGIPVRDQVVLIFSNTAAYLFNYSGDQYFYNSSTAAVGSGIIGPLAVAVLSGIAYWMSPSEFWMWNGAVQPLPSDDIRDFVFKNINLSQSYKFCAGTNIAKKQVIFFYVSANATEIDSYIIYHVDQNCWSTGTVLKRTSWIDRGLFSYPQAVDASGYIYNQDSGVDSNGNALDSYIVFSPMDISNGDRNMDIFCLIPDFERQTGNVNLSILTQNYPQDTATVNGPYTIASDDTTPRIDLRIGAKLAGAKLESNVVGGDWRIGLPRIEAQAAGARR